MKSSTHPLISVVIATFNSSQTLPQVLSAIGKQTLDKKMLEILVIDGGSTDETKSIALQYGCKVIHNPNVEPLYAKFLGYSLAKGKYLTYIDHDEVLLNQRSFKNRLSAFQDNPNIKALVASGYESPKGYKFINRYINEFGDAFSFFVYHLSKKNTIFLQTMIGRYTVVSKTKAYTVVNLATGEIPLIELGAGGGMMDLEYFKQEHPLIMTQYHLIAHVLHLLRSTHPNLIIMNNDAIMHYSSDTFSSYLQKIIWRVKNNIFFTKTLGASGYKGREAYQSMRAKYWKYFFIPYAFSIVIPIFDSLKLVVKRNDVTYLIHVPLTVFTAIVIIYFYLLKLLGASPHLTSYDGTTTAYEHS